MRSRQVFPAPRHLAIQIMRHRAFFMDVAAREAHHGDLGPRRSLPYHVVLLVANLLPVVLLAEPLGKEINYGIEVLNVPTTLGGIVIAVLVLSPEGLTSLQAARRNQLQRSVNLSLGSALSTIGLTIPCMICISLLDGIPLQLGLAPAEAILLVLTLFIAQMTFSGAPTNILLGGVHLVLFASFIVLMVHP